MKGIRNFGLAGAGLLALVTITATPASSHECFNASRAARADAVIAQHSHGWFDIHTSQLVAIFVVSCLQQPSGDCPPPPPLSAADLAALSTGNFEQIVGEILGFIPPEPAVANLLAFTGQVEKEAACLGVPTHYLTLSNATAGGGNEAHSNSQVANGKGIEHFPEVYGGQIFAAYGNVLSGNSSCH